MKFAYICLINQTACVFKSFYAFSRKTANKVGSLFLRCILLRMKELGVSQTELAKRMNASRPYVVKVLHGDVNITLGSAARFAKALQLDFFPDLRDEQGNLYAPELSEA